MNLKGKGGDHCWASILYTSHCGFALERSVTVVVTFMGTNFYHNLLHKKFYSQLFLNGLPYKTDTSVKRTPGVGPCLSLPPLFDSL